MARSNVYPGNRLTAIAGCLLACSTVVAPSRADDAIQARDGLANCFRVLAEAKAGPLPARVMYLGEAVTKGQGASRENLGDRTLTTAQIRRLTPKTEVEVPVTTPEFSTYDPKTDQILPSPAETHGSRVKGRIREQDRFLGRVPPRLRQHSRLVHARPRARQ